MILDNLFAAQKKSIMEDFDQTTDPATGQVTQKYSTGPLNAKQTTDAKGQVVSQDAEIDFGVGKFAAGQAGGVISKAYTPAPGQPGMSSRDLYSLGNKAKAATYDRAVAAVNEAPRLPGSPALAAPKAPRAPAAPTLEEEDQPIDTNLVNQIYQNNQDVIGKDPNLIKPGQKLSLPDGSSYAVQRGDTLTKIAKKIQTPAVAVSGQVPAGLGTLNPDRDEMGVANWKDPNPPMNAPALVGPAAGKIPNKPVTPTGSSVFDVFPDVGGKIYDLTHPSTVPNGPAVAGHPVGTVVRPDWSQTKYRDLGPLIKGSDGVWRTQDGRSSATDPAIIAMAEKMSPVQKAKASPETISAADSMAPGEEIVTAKKPKPPVEQPKRVGTPTPRPNIVQRIEKGAEEKVGQVGNWLSGLVKKRESGDDYDIGHHYAPGTGTAGPDNRKTTAWGAYGLTAAAILAARAEDPALQKPLKQWTPEDQDRAFNIVNGKNLKRLDQLGVDLNKHPEAPSIAIFLGADGAAKYYKTGKFNQDTLDANGGEEAVKKIIAQRTKDSLAALEQQKKQRVKETVATVNTMLETANTADDVRHIRNYIDRQYIRHGMVDQVAFAQRSHLIERVIEITNQRRLLAT